MAVNDVGCHVHDAVAHWATLHPACALGWKQYRTGHLYGDTTTAVMHAPQWQPGVDCVWSIANIGETSGLFACFVGLMLGYDEIVLAGVRPTISRTTSICKHL
jgi:hypothetical protein